MIDQGILKQLLGRALRHGGDYADVFCERRRSYSFRLQDGHIHDGATSIAQGVGIRVVVGESAGYAYSDDLSDEALLRAAEAASLIARGAPSRTSGSIDLTAANVAALYDESRRDHAPAARYVDLLERADRCARAYDPRIVAVNVHVTDELQDVWIATSEGRFVQDHRPMVTLGVQAVASARGERGSG
ncbi:MAG: DNA gyrase modulator, partial [Candidatus Aquilonibacter sp.]